MAGLAALRKHSAEVNAETDKVVAENAKREKLYEGVLTLDIVAKFFLAENEMSNFDTSDYNDDVDRMLTAKGKNWHLEVGMTLADDSEPFDRDVWLRSDFTLLDAEDHDSKYGQCGLRVRDVTTDSGRRAMVKFAKDMAKKIKVGKATDEIYS